MRGVTLGIRRSVCSSNTRRRSPVVHHPRLTTVPVPENPKIYHIVHVDRLGSIIADGYLSSDVEMAKRDVEGTTIGMSSIKQRRRDLKLHSHNSLSVGDCVPFYFCPRSVMLYVIYKANHKELSYRDGQGPIVHLEADFRATVAWAEQQGKRWAFTLSNAGANYVEDRCDLEKLDEIDWHAVRAKNWKGCKERKQAEFLVEGSFPWTLVERIGVCSEKERQEVTKAMRLCAHKPRAEVKKGWYY